MTKINKQTRDLVLFMLLGDGCISKTGTFELTHCAKQKEYIEYKWKLLKNNGINVRECRLINNNGYDGYRFWSTSYMFMKMFRRILYKPNKRIAQRKLLNRLTPLGLAIWYMDDGGLSQKKRNGVIYANELMLNTGLQKDDNQIIIDYFKEVWNIKFNQYKNKGVYRLACGTKEARKFIAIVKPYVEQVQCMKYKLNVKPVSHNFSIENVKVE